MTPLAIKLGDINPRHLEWLRRVTQFIADLPDGDWTCHQVCSEIANQNPDVFSHHRGKFHLWDHSWLVFKDWPTVILDPYPWACGSGPMLVTTNGMTPWRYLYKGDPVDGEAKGRIVPVPLATCDGASRPEGG